MRDTGEKEVSVMALFSVHKNDEVRTEDFGQDSRKSQKLVQFSVSLPGHVGESANKTVELAKFGKVELVIRRKSKSVRRTVTESGCRSAGSAAMVRHLFFGGRLLGVSHGDSVRVGSRLDRVGAPVFGHLSLALAEALAEALGNLFEPRCGLAEVLREARHLVRPEDEEPERADNRELAPAEPEEPHGRRGRAPRR